MSTKRTRLTAARQRLLERILAVAAVVAVLVAAGAWFAMSRPADADVTATGSSGAADGSGSDDYATGSEEDSAGDGGEATASDAPADGQEGSEPGTEADAGSGTGQGSSGSAGSGQGSGSGSGSGTAPSGGSGDGSAPFPDGGVTMPRTPAPTGPATEFLAALEASGLAPPTDDEHRLSFGRDVCDEMDLGSTYTDMVRALTFAGASDAEAENFVRLATTHLCPKHAR